jgi:hypothetical protein
MVAIATVATCLLVYWAAKPSWSVGSMGEWISGLGSFGAVIVAVVVAGRQQALARAQFQDERDHMADTIAEERRYQERLQSMEHSARKAAQADEDFRTANYILRRLSSGMEVATSVMPHIQATPADCNHRAQIVLDTKAFRAAEEAAALYGPHTFKSDRLSRAFDIIVHVWGRVVTTYTILATPEPGLMSEAVAHLTLDGDLETKLAACASVVFLSEPGTDMSEMDAQQAGVLWAKQSLRGGTV